MVFSECTPPEMRLLRRPALTRKRKATLRKMYAEWKAHADTRDNDRSPAAAEDYEKALFGILAEAEEFDLRPELLQRMATYRLTYAVDPMRRVSA
ncbi:MAG: hypothetical protein VW405_13195 [Rhodospirillaceae bacterium]